MKAMVGKTSRHYTISDEVQILEWWKQSHIYETLKNDRKGRQKFYFLDGPPYATNPPHVGTVWNKILKDILIRYKRMKGYDVRDQPGYDCHGLPIEVKVEEELGLKSKKEIEEKIGVNDFISKCKQYAYENIEKQTSVFKNLGIWMDWNNPYMTLQKSYMESIWWTIKSAQEKGLLEKGIKVVHWCPRCETALAGYEVTDEYRTVKDYSVYVKFPLKNTPSKYILIWTTTPWTLPANVAVMVHPDETYVELEFDNDIYILAESRCEFLFKDSSYTIKNRIKGSDLDGLEYQSPLSKYVPLQRKRSNPHQITTSKDYVTMIEGTGCVHTAPGHGEEDFEIGIQKHFPVYSPVDSKGYFTEEAGKYAGLHVKEANPIIVEDLKNEKALFIETEIEHSYPHCWRCKAPLLMRATEQWFIKISSLKDRMLSENGKVYWAPDWAGSKRFNDWLKGARDWVISRQRFWGVPLPIWMCHHCRVYRVMGSLQELQENAIGSPQLNDLHRDSTDPVKVECECGKQMSRVPDIIDVWLDSGVASWASLHYPLTTGEYRKWWPADTIIEAHDQTRGWFYTQLGASVLCFNKAPYKAVLMHGHTLDPNGQKMSKSRGNFIDPIEAASQYGRDALRIYEVQSTTWEDFRFSWDKLKEAANKLKIIWNIISFASLYMNLDEFSPSTWPLNKVLKGMRYEDKWLVSRVEHLKIRVTQAMEKLEFHKAARKLIDFAIEDLSHWYIRLVRRRFWQEKESLDKNAAYSTLYYSLQNFLLLLAPFSPFITELIYREMILPTDDQAPQSIHLNYWPPTDTSFIDTQLERQIDIIRDISAASLSARQALKIKLRQPINKLLVFTDNPEVVEALKSLKELTLQILNSKEIDILSTSTEKQIESLLVHPVFKKLGPIFKASSSSIANALKNSDGFSIRDSISKHGFYELNIDTEKFKITQDMVQFEETLPEGFAGSAFNEGRVYVDSRLTEELKTEGFVQEIVRRIQEMRRQLDLRVDAFIHVNIVFENQQLETLILSSVDYIKEEVRAKILQLSQTYPSEAYTKEWFIEDEKITISIQEE